MDWQMIPGLTIVIASLAAWSDWRTGRIPNWLSLGSVGLGLVWHVSRGACRNGLAGAMSGLSFCALGLSMSALVPMLLYRFAVIGAGDVKLLSALGGLGGPILGLRIQWFADCTLAAYVVLSLTYRGYLFRATAESLVFFWQRLLRRRGARPNRWHDSLSLGPAILVGTLAALLGAAIP